MNKKLCITTYVSGQDYQEFIPVYIFSILKSYPDYFPLIFCGEKLRNNIVKSLEILKKLGSFKVIENYLEEIPNKNVQQLKTKRWFIYSHELIKYEYLYIGDIDIFIVPEKPSLLDQHIIHCKSLGLPYSNIIRCVPDSEFNFKKMSGLHFVKTKPYFKKMLPIIERYKKKKNDEELLDSDEPILFNMIKESGLGLPPRIKYSKNIVNYINFNKSLFRPHHGIHLGLFRSDHPNKEILNSKIYKIYQKIFLEMIKHPIFKRIEKNFESNFIKNIFRNIRIFYKI